MRYTVHSNAKISNNITYNHILLYLNQWHQSPQIEIINMSTSWLSWHKES